MNIEGIIHIEGAADDEELVADAGAILRGRAELLQPAQVECRRVIVSLGWETLDRGNAAKVTLKPQVERPGAWTRGPAGALPFEFTVPREGPVTCKGRLITLRWMIRAEGDVAFKSNPQFRREVIVLPRLWSPEERQTFEAGVWDIDKLTAGQPAPSRPSASAPSPRHDADDRDRRRTDDEPRRIVD